MQCSCGSNTNRRREQYGDRVLTYSECWACGRCGRWRLTQNGYEIASGVEAQRAFNSLEEDR